MYVNRIFVSEEAFMQVAIHPFFDPATRTVTYVVYQAGRFVADSCERSGGTADVLAAPPCVFF